MACLTHSLGDRYITDRSVIMSMSSPTHATSASPPRQRRKEARPQELIDAALELFAEKGFAATRSEEVAARAGVAKGTLYLYYPSKEELLKAVISQRLSSEIAAVAEYSASYEGPCSDLLAEVFTERHDIGVSLHGFTQCGAGCVGIGHFHCAHRHIPWCEFMMSV